MLDIKCILDWAFEWFEIWAEEVNMFDFLECEDSVGFYHGDVAELARRIGSVLELNDCLQEFYKPFSGKLWLVNLLH